jgi:protein-S-isoprenylcysteine O-methyltransferase Ste14
MTIGAFLAFGFFFLGDLNDVRFRVKHLRFCFPLGLLLLVIFTILSALTGPDSPLEFFGKLICGAFAVLFLLLTVYALFFALPFKEAYTAPGEKRSADTRGVYALCRHPGVLFFAPLYLLLWLSVGIAWRFAVLCILLNLMLALFEDLYVFPRILHGYAQYRHTTPFLIPNLNSIRLCLRSL